MPTFTARIAQESGLPLGGLGTGSVEIRADGYFHEWQVFNSGAWAPQQPECCAGKSTTLPPGALSFFVRTQATGAAPQMRRLGLRMDQHNLYSFSWLKSVEAIEFTGRYPVAELAYQDHTLPVAISSRVFSPMVPHEARISGTPGFYAAFRVRNVTMAPVTVSLLGVLANPVALGADERQLVNSVAQAGDATLLTMRSKAKAHCLPTLGSMCLGVTGGEASWVLGEFPGAVTGTCAWGSVFGFTFESLLHDFLAAGRLPSLAGGTSPASLLQLSDDELAALPRVRKQALIAELRRYPFAASVWERVNRVDAQALSDEAGLTAFLKDVRWRLNHFEGDDRRRQTWGSGALASALTLAPGEEREVVFLLGWHFPYHYSAKGPVLGHQYEHWFADAEAVGRFLGEQYPRVQPKVTAFANTLFDTSLPPEFADAWAGQLTTIPKCTWWLKNGDFAVWEGLGCCGFHTTDITYQGSFNLLALFPELQQRQMEMGARFQRDDGRVHHFFTPDLSAVDNGFDRVDMNQQFVLLVCRDYLWTGDREYLKRLWPHLVQAMDATAELDTDGDGLPDQDTKRNTYDCWNFRGIPSYIASLWIGALVAAVRMAEDLGQKAIAAKWRGLLRKAAASFDQKLWNGEYYSLWVDGQERDECCMTDQLDGEWFTQLIGLGYSLPRERIVAALQAVVRHNYSEEAGLINASYPAASRPLLCTYANLQAMAPWTGIEYAIGSMMLDFGLCAEGANVIRNVHERYAGAGRFWNHVECGDHYYRAMCSWAVLLAATGFKRDVPRQAVTFAPPAVAECRAPWVDARGWGSFALSPTGLRLTCAAGALDFKELRLKLATKPTVARCRGRKLPFQCRRKDGLTVLVFGKAVALRADDVLVIE